MKGIFDDFAQALEQNRNDMTPEVKKILSGYLRGFYRTGGEEKPYSIIYTEDLNP